MTIILAYLSDICFYAHGVDVIAVSRVAIGLEIRKKMVAEIDIY